MITVFEIHLTPQMNYTAIGYDRQADCHCGKLYVFNDLITGSVKIRVDTVHVIERAL